MSAQSMQSMTLQEALSQVRDFRNPQGRRYQLQAVLGLACLAMMHGAGSEGAIARWGETEGRRWLRLLGIRRRRGPSLSTIQRIFRGVDRAELESAMRQWSGRTAEAVPGEEAPLDTISRWVSEIIGSLPAEGGEREARIEQLAVGSFQADPSFQSLGEGGLKIWAVDLERDPDPAEVEFQDLPEVPERVLVEVGSPAVRAAA